MKKSEKEKKTPTPPPSKEDKGHGKEVPASKKDKSENVASMVERGRQMGF